MKTVLDSVAIKPPRKGMSGSTLKGIAMILMLLDHIGFVVLERILIGFEQLAETDPQRVVGMGKLYLVASFAYYICRILGRCVFPIFCFLLVQGFLHTHNLKKYLGRLLLFALISEIPFNLAVSGKFIYIGFQNTIFTLFLGMLALAGIRMAEEKHTWHLVWRILFGLLSVGLCTGISGLLESDAKIVGVLMIAILYLLRRKRMLSQFTICTLNVNSYLFQYGFLSMLPVYFYNGKRGNGSKWIFYIFYPAHFLLLYGVACALGIGQISIL